MAQIPLNYFLRVAADLLITDSDLYTTPTQRATIVLAANAANKSTNIVSVTLKVRDTSAVETTILKNFEIPPGDAANLIQGKLILGVGDVIVASASVSNQINLNLSLLESFNTPTA